MESVVVEVSGAVVGTTASVVGDVSDVDVTTAESGVADGGVVGVVGVVSSSPLHATSTSAAAANTAVVVRRACRRSGMPGRRG
ncbi:MAG: hypothetical protein QNJ12_20530 [Ilumatobacter sp.]|nr:hypothetical protein [Ilumatobacter sp.]